MATEAAKAAKGKCKIYGYVQKDGLAAKDAKVSLLTINDVSKEEAPFANDTASRPMKLGNNTFEACYQFDKVPPGRYRIIIKYKGKQYPNTFVVHRTDTNKNFNYDL